MKKIVAVFGLSLFGSFANAALPTVVGTSITAIQTDALSLIDLGWPLLVAVFGGLLFMKLFKKVGNKAT